MGNKAVIAFSENPNSTAVYLHWNGGLASVQGFCDAARALHFRSSESDNSYAVARFAQLVGNFFKGTLSVGVGPLCEQDCDNGDNGLYIVGGNWQIVGRKFHSGEEEINAEKTAAICAECVAAFPLEKDHAKA